VGAIKPPYTPGIQETQWLGGLEKKLTKSLKQALDHHRQGAYKHGPHAGHDW